MKYVLVTIRRGVPPEPAMMYPGVYDAVEVERNKKGPIVYEGALSFGEDIEECLIYLKDAVADAYALHADVQIITEAQADTWLSANRQLQRMPEVRVTNADRLVSIALKQQLGEELDEEDLRVLDPDEPVRGISRVPKTTRGLFG